MRRSKVLAKWRQGQFARFSGMGHVLPFFIRYSAHYGYDGIWLDLEHRNMDSREVQHLLALGHLYDIDIMVRPPTTMRGQLYRHLEDGATGLMIPFVSTPEIAHEIVAATKYPPLGNRGLDGAGLDTDFGLFSWKDGSTYIEDANRETFIVAQIETLAALENAEAIAAVPGIDLLFLGPADMQLRIDADSASKLTIADATQAVKTAADRQGKLWGRTAGSAEELARYRAMGAAMVPLGSDFSLMNVLRDASAAMDAVLD